MNNEVKKEFQKVVARIRAERNKSRERKSEYPKAMMTGQQIKKRTATVNCCGNKTLAAEVAAHPDFIAFLRKHNATARLEEVSFGSSYTQQQVRIIFPAGQDGKIATVVVVDDLGGGNNG